MNDLWELRLERAMQSQRHVVIWQTHTGHGWSYLDIKPGVFRRVDSHGYIPRKWPTPGYQNRVLKTLHTKKWSHDLVRVAVVKEGHIIEEFKEGAWFEHDSVQG